MHSLRDHPNHDRPLNGGMWGGRKGAVPDMPALIRKSTDKEEYGGDLDFLNEQVRTYPHPYPYPYPCPYPEPEPEPPRHVPADLDAAGDPSLADVP